jgi:hypothetical protein
MLSRAKHLWLCLRGAAEKISEIFRFVQNDIVDHGKEQLNSPGVVLI